MELRQIKVSYMKGHKLMGMTMNQATSCYETRDRNLTLSQTKQGKSCDTRLIGSNLLMRHVLYHSSLVNDTESPSDQ